MLSDDSASVKLAARSAETRASSAFVHMISDLQSFAQFMIGDFSEDRLADQKWDTPAIYDFTNCRVIDICCRQLDNCPGQRSGYRSLGVGSLLCHSGIGGCFQSVPIVPVESFTIG